ncbi:hypothetical protein MTR_3g437980 [Medicago truncatula]|uniref:Uncharacterized protein n=1 Tax=Medicago truncatula TaxID=3880 RepID=A0A072V5G4_MEDTR|nr:hypothetical protein MTR_3g437980 [Medicago truncatula]
MKLLLFKVDIENAYDYVGWKYLDDVMRKTANVSMIYSSDTYKIRWNKAPALKVHKDFLMHHNRTRVLSSRCRDAMVLGLDKIPLPGPNRPNREARSRAGRIKRACFEDVDCEIDLDFEDVGWEIDLGFEYVGWKIDLGVDNCWDFGS